MSIRNNEFRVYITIFLYLIVSLASANIITNSKFEGEYISVSKCSTGAIITGEITKEWEDNTCWAGSPTVIHYARDNDPQRGDTQKVQVTSGKAQFIHPVSLNKSQIYTANVKMRASTPVKVILCLRQAADPYNLYVDNTYTVTPIWQTYSITGMVDTVAGYFMIIITSPATVWINEVELVESPAATLTESISTDHSTKRIDREYFGMHIHSPLLVWPLEVIGAIRIWDTDGLNNNYTTGQWNSIHTAPGTFNWSSLDAQVQRATYQHASIIMNLGRTPHWASARPNEPSKYQPGEAAEPADDRVWREWVYNVGKRYKGRIKYWEIWNEPNDPGFFSGTPEKLISLAHQANNILKVIDRNNQIISPSPYKIDYLDTYLKLGGGKYADIIGYHFYIGRDPEILYHSYIPNVRLVMQKYKVNNKPLWNTESGWTIPETTRQRISDNLAAAYVARSYLLNWARQVEHYYFYAWDNYGMDVQLTSPNSTTLTPAGIAFQEIAHWMIGKSMTKIVTETNNTWTITLKDKKDRATYIIWNPLRNTEFTLPSSWDVRRLRKLDGKIQAIASKKHIIINYSPILIE